MFYIKNVHTNSPQLIYHIGEFKNVPLHIYDTKGNKYKMIILDKVSDFHAAFFKFINNFKNNLNHLSYEDYRKLYLIYHIY